MSNSSFAMAAGISPIPWLLGLSRSSSWMLRICHLNLTCIGEWLTSVFFTLINHKSTYNTRTFLNIPRYSMYGIFTSMYHEKSPNVGKYTIHGILWDISWGVKLYHFRRSTLRRMDVWTQLDPLTRCIFHLPGSGALEGEVSYPATSLDLDGGTWQCRRRYPDFPTSWWTSTEKSSRFPVGWSGWMGVVGLGGRVALYSCF